MAETNRRTIEVQLHLIADADIKKLEQVFGQFSDSLGSVSSSHGQRAGALPAKSGTSHGLKSQNLDWQLKERAAAEGHRIPMRQPYPHELAANDGLFGGIANTVGAAKSRIGQSWVGRTAGFVDENWAAIYAGNIALQKAMGAQRTVSNTLFGGSATQLGTQLGLSQGGYGGTPIGSPAFMAGIENKIYALKHFTDPNASAAQGLTNSYGWDTSGKMGGKITGLVSSMLRAGIDPDTAAKWAESLRYGGTNIAALTGQIKTLGDQAKASHETVGHFVQAVEQQAEALGQSTGIPVGMARGQVSAISGAAGVDPSVIGQIMNNPTYRGMAVAMTNGDMAKAVAGNKAGVYQLKAMESLIAPQLGYKSFTEIAQAIKRGNPKEMHALWNRLLWLYQGAPELFNGVSPTEFLRMIANFGSDKGMAAGISANTSFQRIQAIGGTPQDIQSLKHNLMDVGISKGAIDSAIRTGNGSIQDKAKRLQDLYSNRMHKMNENQSQLMRVEIGLKGDAWKYIRAVTSMTGNDTSSSGPAVNTTPRFIK